MPLAVRALLVWLVLMVLAILNGGIREAALTPRFGDGIGRRLSTISLSLGILVVAGLAAPWMGAGSISQAVAVGGFWLALTLGFEFGFGRLVMRKSWKELTADYDLRAGRIWVLVLIVTFLAPLVAGRVRGLY